MIYPVTLSDKFDFGKYKGEEVQEVAEIDPYYIEWCIDNVEGFELTNTAYTHFQRCLQGFKDDEGGYEDAGWGDMEW